MKEILLSINGRIILKDGIEQTEYRFEHDNKPQLLNEDK